MSVIIKGEIYYRTREACSKIGIHRSTLLRWLKFGIIRDASHKDRRGWRLFTETDIRRIQQEAHKIK